jgi:lipopolysaccharide transport system permease protein
VNPQQPFSLSPMAMGASFWTHRRLIWQLTRREVVGRYRGSVLGLVWSMVNPLLMLGVYTFVFSVIFQPRWGTGASSRADFALMMFTGMIVYGLFSECASKAPSLILANSSLVKRVVFPLEVLPWVSLGSALFHTAVSFAVLAAFLLARHTLLPWTALAVPVVLLPLVLMAVGVSWFLASLGVYLRDVGHTIGIILMMLLFLCPVIYPSSAVPDEYRPLLDYNPIAVVIEQTRAALLTGGAIDWVRVATLLVSGVVVASLGFAWFQKTRRGFADVL